MIGTIVVGCGYSGAVCARLIAEKFGESVMVLEKRNHIGGNMFEETNAAGVVVHKYGPHISVFNDERVFSFVSRFTEWIPYEHRVNALVDGIEVPLPFNFNSIKLLFEKEKANRLIQSLLSEYGENESVPILELRKSNVCELKVLADFVYEKIFLHYTTKMWGLSPTEIDPSVTGRVPVRLSYDDRHFLHRFQVMPKFGYNKLFENMLDHEKIKVRINANANDYISINSKTSEIFFEGEPFSGRLIYTGSLDELFSFCYGELPYRTLRFLHETHKRDGNQQTAVLNFPDSRPETRRTEMKKLTQQKMSGVTSTLTEYPGAYLRGDMVWGEPYYPIINSEYLEMHKKYAELAKKIPNLYPVGRLAEYRYYNMEDTIKRGIETVENMR